MKSRLLTIVLLLVLTASLFGPLGGVTVAQAQTTCTDPATGATIPCPPSGGDNGSDDTDDSDGNGGGSQPGGGNPNPPSVITATPSPTPSPEPTSTPLPIQAKPTQDPTQNAPVFEVTPTPTAEPVITSAGNDGSTDGDNDWEDVCTFDLCLGLTAACYWDGGTPEIVEDGSGNTGVHCNIPDDDDGASFPVGPTAFAIVIIVGVVAVPTFIRMKRKPKPSAQTREHILLAGKGKNNDSATPGDWDGDGDVDGRDFVNTSSSGSTQGAAKPTPKPKPKPKPTATGVLGTVVIVGLIATVYFLGCKTGFLPARMCGNNNLDSNTPLLTPVPTEPEPTTCVPDAAGGGCP